MFHLGDNGVCMLSQIGRFRRVFAVHPHRYAVVAAHGAEVFPSVAFVEGRVFRDEVECVRLSGGHVGADVCQQFSGDAPVAAFRLDVQGTYVRCEVLAVVEIVFDYAGSGDDFFSLHGHVPLRDGGGAPDAFVDACQVFFHRDVPFLVKPPCGGNAPLRVFAKGDDVVNVHNLSCCI